MAVAIDQQAPDFELVGSAPMAVKMSDYKGKKNVILTFYEVAFNFEDVDQIEAFRDLEPEFDTLDAQIVAISLDPTGVCVAFSQTSNIDFPLLSDHMDHAVCTNYDAWRTDRGYASVEGGIAKRVTYVIDKNGMIRGKVNEDVPAAKQAPEALKLAKSILK